MPIYEYRCNACGHTLEKLQKISDAPLVTCPACGADALARLVSAAGFRLKGGGWYETDFKTGGRRNVAGEKDGGKGAGKDGGKSADTGGKAAPGAGAGATSAKKDS